VACDVFKEDPSQPVTEFAGNSCDMGPEVPWIVDAFALSCHAERLAWVSGKDGVDSTSEWLGIECGEVVPDWGWGEVSGALCRDDG